jgi:1,4-alpha-glucan branching enzyme
MICRPHLYGWLHEPESFMRDSSRLVVFFLLFPCLSVLLGAVEPVRAAGPDNAVEWDGVSHIEFQDRRPLCPISNEEFSVRFQSYRDDLTGARLFLDDGGSTSWISATVIAHRGQYDIWGASVPATSANNIGYYLELTDGTDTDYLSVSGMSETTPVDGGWPLDFTTLDHAPVGATLATGGTVFKVWATGAVSCHVRGEFNGWGLGNQLTRVGEHFIDYVSGTSAGDEYKYFFGPGDIWKPDARARAFNSGSNSNSIIEDPFGYQWLVADFQTPQQAEMVVYQLHMGTFAGRNDPAGSVTHPAGYLDVAARVGHLVELGVNTVMFNPVNEFPGDESAGYNPITAWAPEWAYGSADDFKYLVDMCHQNGIAVLLDIVWNHFSVNDNYLWNYDGTQFYFDDPAADTPWGAQADFDSEGVRDYYLHSALHWLEEYKLDGYRMDATDFMNNVQGSGWSLMQEFNDLIDNRFAGKVAVAEQLPDDDWVTRPTSLGGAGFDCQYYDYFTDTIREEIFDAAFGDPEMWKIRNIINGGGTYLNGASVFNYFELHDEAWESSGGGRAVKVIDTSFPHDDEWATGRTKLAHGIVMLAPGIPAFLMGCEWLEDTDFGTGSSDRIDWVHKINYNKYFAYFKGLITVRDNPAFHADASRYVHHLNESGNVIGFRRWDAENDFVVVANFSNNDYTGYRIGLPQDGYWREALNSMDFIYGGSGPVNGGTLIPDPVAYNGYSQSIAIELPKMAFVVLQKGGVQTDAGETTTPSVNTLEPNYPNPFNPVTTIRFSLAESGQASLRIYDVSGRLVRSLVDDTVDGGMHEVLWDGTNNRGDRTASGVYFYRLLTDRFTKTRRMVLLR